MNIHEEYDDNNLNHVLCGPDYGQTYLGKYTKLSWLIENSFDFEYFNSFENNGVIIEPCLKLND